ncbi:helix-turn-helix domain-containing protein [Bartonella japonica]|uniref:helix-turn-helix domain-containing protein n=1 Tax=Bartonella japonica TaxID=357761 RepID=UPI003391687B
MPKSSFEEGEVPIVFKSNKRRACEIKRCETCVSVLFLHLYDISLIIMCDSANFKQC